MFSFLKRDKKAIELPIPKPLLVDLHSHLVPGIDDGAKDIDESIALILALMNLGYKKLITTPHTMFDNYRNTPITILSGLEILEKECQKLGLRIELGAASEYYVDEGLIELIIKGDVLTIADKYLLFETSYTHRPYRLEEIIFEIGAAGHIPMLAHPERYRYMKEQDYAKLKELGVMFQVNLNSFNGYYGSGAQKNAHFLSENGFIDFLGSDTHNLHQLHNLEKMLQSDDYKRIYLKNNIKNNLL